MPQSSNAVVSRRLARVALVVDDETHILEKMQTWLGKAGWDCVCVRTVSEALDASRDPTLTLALIDYRLDTGDDGIRLGRVFRQRRGLPFILFSGYLNIDLTVAAIKAGAADAIEKPLTETRLRESIERVANAQDRLTQSTGPDTALGGEDLSIHELAPARSRWSRMILRTCRAPTDPNTVALWAKFLNVSDRFVREVCFQCHVNMNSSCDLARFLRAIARSKATAARLEDHFTVGDDRTLNSLFRRAGLDRRARIISLHDFFNSQTFIPTTEPCLKELAHLAANSPFFF